MSPCCLPACLLAPFSPLQARLADSNRNLAAKVLNLLGAIARAMGPPFDACARPVLLFPAVASLADNKKQVGGGVGGVWLVLCVSCGVLMLLVRAVA